MPPRVLCHSTQNIGGFETDRAAYFLCICLFLKVPQIIHNFFDCDKFLKKVPHTVQKKLCCHWANFAQARQQRWKLRCVFVQCCLACTKFAQLQQKFCERSSTAYYNFDKNFVAIEQIVYGWWLFENTQLRVISFVVAYFRNAINLAKSALLQKNCCQRCSIMCCTVHITFVAIEQIVCMLGSIEQKRIATFIFVA